MQRDSGPAGRQSADRHVARPARAAAARADRPRPRGALHARARRPRLRARRPAADAVLPGRAGAAVLRSSRSRSGFASRSTTRSRATRRLHPGAVPQLAFRRIATEPFEVLGARVTPIRLKHGPAVRRARLSLRQRGLLHRRERDSAGEHGAACTGSTCWCSTRCGRAAHATHFSLEEAIEVARAARAAADVLHAHVARAGARGDERGAAAGHGAGVRRAADCADVKRSRGRRYARRPRRVMLIVERFDAQSVVAAESRRLPATLRLAACGLPTAILWPPSRSR